MLTSVLLIAAIGMVSAAPVPIFTTPTGGVRTTLVGGGAFTTFTRSASKPPLTGGIHTTPVGGAFTTPTTPVGGGAVTFASRSSSTFKSGAPTPTTTTFGGSLFTFAPRSSSTFIHQSQPTRVN